MFNYTQDEKELIYITPTEALSTYFVGLEKNSITKTELNTWSKFLERELSNATREVKVINNPEALAEIEREGQYFSVSDHSIKLKPNCDQNHLAKYVLMYMPREFMIEVINTPKVYAQNAQDDELVCE